MSKLAVSLTGMEPETLATQISDLYQTWNTSRQAQRDELREIEQYLYATSTKQTTNKKNPWSHSTHIPKLCQIYDNLGTQYASAVVGREDFFTFEPGNANAAVQSKKKAVVSYLKTKHKYSKFRVAIKELLNDWSRVGNCFAQLQYVRESVRDRTTGLPVVVYEGPKLLRISPDDIEFDITAASFAEAPKIVRQLVNMGEFLREVEERPELRYDAGAVEKVKTLRSVCSANREADVNKIDARQIAGFGSFHHYMSSGKIELLHFYGDIYDVLTGTLHKDAMITVVDRRYVLRNTPSDDWTNVGQIYHCGWRKRPDNLWAQGPLNKIVGMQYLIDHLVNAKSDAFDQMLSPDEVYIGQVETIVEGPVRKHFIDDGEGSVTQLKPDSTVLNADFQIDRLEAQMEAYAGAPREAMGIRTPGEKTAFEFDGLMNAASRLFQIRIDDFEQEFLDLILNGEIELAQRNLSTSDLVEMMDDDFGVLEFKSITKEDLLIRGKISPQGASHYAKRSQAVRELQQFQGILSGDPALAVHFPAKPRAKMWNELMDFDRYGLYQEFGGVAEQLELQQVQGAAQQLGAKQGAAAGLGAELEQDPDVTNG